MLAGPAAQLQLMGSPRFCSLLKSNYHYEYQGGDSVQYPMSASSLLFQMMGGEILAVCYLCDCEHHVQACRCNRRV